MVRRVEFRKQPVIAIAFQALWMLTKTSLKTIGLKVTTLVLAILYLLGANQLTLHFGCGLIAAAA